MSWKEAAEQHAVKEMPREACGLLVLKGGEQHYFPCRNMAPGDYHFIMDPTDYMGADLAGEIIAVVHSHPNAPATPSDDDIMACNATGLTWHIVSVPSLAWEQLEPKRWDN